MVLNMFTPLWHNQSQAVPALTTAVPVGHWHRVRETALPKKSPLTLFPEHPESGSGRRSAPRCLPPQPMLGTVGLSLPRLPVPVTTACPQRGAGSFPLSQRTPAGAATRNPLPLMSLFGLLKERKLKMQRTKFGFGLFFFFLFPLRFLKETKESDRIQPGQGEPTASALPAQPPPENIAHFSV